MGKPEHHCDPKDPPYIKYTQQSTTTTTSPPVSSYIEYPNPTLPCPDLAYKSDSFEGLGCVKLSGTPYEVLASNVYNDCRAINFSVIDDQCSKGAIVQYICCEDTSYTNVLVNGNSISLCLKSGGELRKIYGNIDNVYLSSSSCTTPCPELPIPICASGYGLITSINEFGCTVYECVPTTTTTTTTTTPCPCPREINPSGFHIAYRDISPCEFAPASNPLYNQWTNLPLAETTYKIYIDVFLSYERVLVFYRDPITAQVVDLYDLDNVTHEFNSTLSEAPCCEDFGSSVLIDNFTKPSGVDALTIAISSFTPTISAVVVGICPLGEEIFIDDCGSPTTTTPAP